MRIEICTENENEDFEHYAYCASIDNAITVLKNLKFDKCNHCIHYPFSCAGAETCPPNKKYKKDPPDGGYYG